jgi:hypothetical protein
MYTERLPCMACMYHRFLKEHSISLPGQIQLLEEDLPQANPWRHTDPRVFCRRRRPESGGRKSQTNGSDTASVIAISSPAISQSRIARTLVSPALPHRQQYCNPR